MKPILLTCALGDGHDPFARMIDLFEPWHLRYCKLHEYEMVAPKTSHAVKSMCARDVSMKWAKIHLILSQLKRDDCEFLVWLDADAVVAKPDIDLRCALEKWASVGMTCHAAPDSVDMVHWNAGVIYIRNGEFSKAFFQEVADREIETTPIGRRWTDEQTLMHHLLLNEGWQRGLQTLHCRWNNNQHGDQLCWQSVVAAFHGHLSPEDRVQYMAQWARYALPEANL